MSGSFSDSRVGAKTIFLRIVSRRFSSVSLARGTILRQPLH